MCGFISNRFCIYLYSTVFNHTYKTDFDDEMRVADGIFLIGIVLIVLLASTMLLLFSRCIRGSFLASIKACNGNLDHSSLFTNFLVIALF